MNFKLLVVFFLLINIGEVFAISKNLRRYNDDPEIKVRIEKKSKQSSDKDYVGHYKVGNPYTVLGETFYPKEVSSYKTVGTASWYGADFHNKKTANGEIFNMDDFTAAHPTLQLPCMVRVTNLENGKSIKVRVNDRGPFAKQRVIDVSKATAIELGFFQKGTAKVKVEYLPKESESLLKQCGLK